MNTYLYRFPVSGNIHNQSDFARQLTEKLNAGSDCLGAYCIFPTDSDILSHISFDSEGAAVNYLNLHTYTKLWDGAEEDLETCVCENLETVENENNLKFEDRIRTKDSVEYMGLEGKLPETLYHIAEKDDVKQILRDGISPHTGDNSYKSPDSCVYMTDDESLVKWLTVLPNLENPVIIEVNTDGIEDLEPGRHFSDRGYMESGYGEYRTKSTIGPENIEVMEITSDMKMTALHISREAEQQINRMSECDDAERTELKRLISRLDCIGLDTSNLSEMIAEQSQPRQMTLKEFGLEDPADSAEEVPWDEKEAGDGLTEALGQMSSKGFGVDM